MELWTDEIEIKTVANGYRLDTWTRDGKDRTQYVFRTMLQLQTWIEENLKRPEEIQGDPT